MKVYSICPCDIDVHLDVAFSLLVSINELSVVIKKITPKTGIRKTCAYNVYNVLLCLVQKREKFVNHIVCCFFTGYDFVVGKMSPANGSLFINYEEVIRIGPEPLYVNFQWAELDTDGNKMYVLIGNENSPARLKARIYTFDLQQL